MFVIGRPGIDDLDRVLSEQASGLVTYGEVGATRERLPAGYRHDRHVVELGAGDEVFRRAIEGLHGWQAHRRAGLLLRPAAPPLRQDETVVFAVNLLVVSVIAACRIVYVMEEADRFGFAYGTLPAHPEQGEEAFVVERDDRGIVRFVVTAFSRPRHPLARFGSPLARQIQMNVNRRYLDGLAGFVAGR